MPVVDEPYYMDLKLCTKRRKLGSDKSTSTAVITQHLYFYCRQRLCRVVGRCKYCCSVVCENKPRWPWNASESWLSGEAYSEGHRQCRYRVQEVRIPYTAANAIPGAFSSIVGTFSRSHRIA